MSIIKLLIFLVVFSFNTYAQNQNDFKKDLEIVDSSISFNDESGYTSISIIGNISNKSDKKYRNLVIEIKFFDTNKALIDTFTNELYSNIFLANDNASFRLQASAAKPQDQYSSHSLRILEADIKQPCNKKSGFRKFLANWGGFIFVVIFIFYLGFAVITYQKSLKEEKQYKQKFLDIANHQIKQSETAIKLLENIAKNKQ